MLRSLRARILAGYGLALVLVVVVLAVALMSTARLGQASDTLLRRNYASIRAADRMIDALERMDSGTLLTVAGDAGGRAQTAAHADSFAAAYARAASNVTEPGESRVVARLGSAFGRYRTAALGSAEASAPGEAYRQRLLPAFMEARAEAVRLRDLNGATMARASGQTRADARRAFRLTLGVGLAAVAVGLAFSLALASALVRPLRAMRSAADAIGRGRYDVVLPAPTDADLGGLARAMAAMAQSLRDYDALNVHRLLGEKRKTDAVLQAMDDGLVVVDAGMRVAAANPAAERALGRLAPGALLDTAVADARVVAAVREALGAGHGAGPDAAPRFVADASGRHVQYVVTVLGGLPGGPPTAILLLRDLTRLRETERLKNEFVRAASHELRTPLTGLEMALSMLQAPVAARLDAPDQALLGVALDEQRRLSALAADLLDLARMEAGQAALDLAPVDLRALLADAAARFAAQAAGQNATVEAVPGPPLPPVRADAARLALVLSNLVANALRHVGAGGHVRLSAEATAGGPVGRPSVRLAVADDGPGIPPEWHRDVFEPLVQIPDGRVGGASGLGLAICDAIVRAHGGTIRVGPAAAGGAVFEVTLPLPGGDAGA